MKGTCKTWLTLVACAAVTWCVGHVAADETKKVVKGESVPMPTPAEVQALAVQPVALTLRGVDDSAQLVVTGQLAGNRLQDLSGDTKYEVANPALARVTTAGRIIPLANG